MVLVLLCVLGFVFGQVQNGARSRGRPDLASSAVQTLSSPVSAATTRSSQAVSDFLYGLFRARRLAIENQRLYDRLRATSLYTERSSEMAREIDGLRNLLRLPDSPGKTKVFADVVGIVPNDHRITIAAGSKQGLRPNMPVVGPAGLVGTVQTVAPSRSQVLLMMSRGVTLGAIVIDRNPAPIGLLQGENGTTLRLTFQDPKAPVQVGDTVATSGMSDYIPRGIPIGRVVQVEDDAAYGERRAVVDPYTSLGELRVVAVLK